MSPRARLAAALLEVRALLLAGDRKVYGAMEIASRMAGWLRSETPVDSPRWDELLDLARRLRRDDLPTAAEVDGWLAALEGRARCGVMLTTSCNWRALC